MEQKKCRICEKNLPKSAFYVHKKGTKETLEVLSSYCKACENHRKREWYQANKEREQKKRKEWQRNNLDKQCIYSARYRKKLKEKFND